MRNIRHLIKKYDIWILLVIAVIVSVISTIYYFSHHDILAYNDARSRIDIARRITDNKNTGLVQLGTVWLPLLPLLMFPFMLNHYLWVSGLGGSIVSMLAFIVASLFIFKTLKLATKKSWLSFVGSFLFMANINVLYLQTTAMEEVLLFALLMGAIYFLFKWLYQKRTIDLVWTAFFGSLSTLVRYEGWLFIVIASLIVYIENRYISERKSKAQGQTILYLTLAAFGILLWFLWNLVIFGSPTYFLSAQNGQYSLGGTGTPTPQKYHLWLTITSVIKSSSFDIGVPLLIVVALAIFMIFFKRGQKNRKPFYLLALLLAPILLNFVSIFLGIIPLSVKSLLVANGTRYTLSIVLLAAVLIPIAISKLNKTVALCIAIIVLALSFTVHNTALDSAIHGGEGLAPRTVSLISYFKSNYHGGNILATSTFPFGPTEQALGIPLKNYISEGDGKLWTNALKQPAANHVQYILMDSQSNPDPVYNSYAHVRNNYNFNYRTIYEKDGYYILIRSKTSNTIIANEKKINKATQKSSTNTNISLSTNVNIVVQQGDSESSIVETMINALDKNKLLNQSQFTMVETNMVDYIGDNNFIVPGQIVSINLTYLQKLINQAQGTLSTPPTSASQSNANVKIAAGDSESLIVRREIHMLDSSHELSNAEEAFVEGTMVNMLGANDLIYAGQSLELNLNTLNSLIAQSKQLSVVQLAAWQVYGNTISY